MMIMSNDNTNIQVMAHAKALGMLGGLGVIGPVVRFRARTLPIADARNVNIGVIGLKRPRLP